MAQLNMLNENIPTGRAGEKMSETMKAYHSLGVHCHWSSITGCLSALVPGFNSAHVFLAEHGLKTDYQIEKKRDFSGFLLTNHLSRLYPAFFQRNGMNFEYVDMDCSFSELLKRIEQENDRGFPVAISLFSREIPYHAAFHSTSSNMHCVAVSAVEPDRLYVHDLFIPTHPVSGFHGWVEAEQLKPGWEDSIKKVYLFNREEVDFLEKNCRGKIKREELFSELREYLKTGRTGIALFLQDFRECAENNPQTIRENARQICFALQFDSVVPSRKLLAEIFKRVGPEYSETADQLEQFVKEWYKITFSLMKYSYGRTNTGFIRISQRMDRVVEQERQLLMDICEWTTGTRG